MPLYAKYVAKLGISAEDLAEQLEDGLGRAEVCDVQGFLSVASSSVSVHASVYVGGIVFM